VRRRRSLALLGGVALVGVAEGCRSAPPDRRARVGGLGVGERRVIEHGGEPIEVARTPDGVVARSLLCTHFGCRVAWDAAARRYHCPCHEGAFDAAGQPVAGLPTRALRAVPVALDGDVALVGEP
jgi:Rieske Fe-S protein